ncbi:MAG: mechanosensitive ion channel family protein [Sphingomonadaceae bacterium]
MAAAMTSELADSEIAADVEGVSENISERTLGLVESVERYIEYNSSEALIAFAIGLFLALVMVGVRAAGARLARRDIETQPTRAVIGRVFARTGLVFIVLVAAELVTEYAGPPEIFRELVHFLFVVAAVLQGAVWVREIVLGIVEHRAGAEDATGRLGSALGIIRLLVTIALFAIALILILDNLGVNVTGLVAGLGIGGIAIGLAAQGIFSDLFAALSIIFDKPFKRGDTINYGGLVGRVENIGLKTTRIRALDGEQVIVSNARLLEEKLHNYALNVRRRVVLHFGVIYQTPAELLARVPEETRAIVEARERSTFDRCHAFQFGESSIDFELVFNSESPEYVTFMQERHEVMMALVRRFEELGIDFAYPTQMGFLAGLDGKPVDPRDIPVQHQPAP